MKKIRRYLSLLLALVMFLGLCNGNFLKEVQAATGTASNVLLTDIGNFSIGGIITNNKIYKLMINGNKVFCMDIDKTSHTGDVYEDSDKVYKSTSSNKKESLEAKIGYWYDHTKQSSNPAYVYAQCLIWGVERDVTSEAGLKNIIQNVMNHTGYYKEKGVDAVYNQIFNVKSCECKVKIWKYKGTGASRQSFLEVKTSTTPTQPKWKTTSGKENYRQRLTIYKMDDQGQPLKNIKFQLVIKNMSEMYFCKVNGDSVDTSDADSRFDITEKTDENGKLAFRFDYQLSSREYAYVSDADLKKMTDKDISDMKEKLKEEGLKYHTSLTKEGAEKRVQEDLQDQFHSIADTYILKELETDKDHILATDYAKGKTLTITRENSWTKDEKGNWPDAEVGGNYSKTVKENVINRHKKVTVNVVKKDSYSSDGKAHGAAKLDGAVYRLYADPACTYPAVVYTADGQAKHADPYTVRDGSFETDYLLSGTNYYLKEIQAPEGYEINSQVMLIQADGSGYSAEQTPNAQTVTVTESPKLGQISIHKNLVDAVDESRHNEEGATFQLYLKSAGSYEAANADYERDLLVMDKDGKASSKKLYCGTYIIHQTSSGKNDSKMIEDQEVVISENGQNLGLDFDNQEFGAYLKIVKIDAETKKTVLKPNTAYKIYKIEEDGQETLLTQEYEADGHHYAINKFITDKTGEIITPKKLKSGKYKIYETDAAGGLYISDKYVEISIHSSKDNYVTKTDENGREYAILTVEYSNHEQKGKLRLAKTGEVPANGENDEKENPKLTYIKAPLKGAVFEITAAEDIVTQDAQGDTWFQKDDKVATVTTGEGAEFTSECAGLCTAKTEEDDSVTLTLPLGRYTIKEIKTIYGYIHTDKTWTVEFKPGEKEAEFVTDSTGTADENGTLNIENERAKAKVSIVKKDEDTKKPVEGAVFGFYTKDNIYGADGKVIAEAGQLLEKVVTDAEGKATVQADVPLMSENYTTDDKEDKQESKKENSGDYYFKELEISDSYYLDSAEVPLHLAYADDKTPEIAAEAVKENRQTDVEISKRAVTGSEELAGCLLEVREEDGKVVAGWTSGQADSIKLMEHAEEAGYRNLSAAVNEKNAVSIKGLKHEKAYTLVETRPADGYVTADQITFKLSENPQSHETIVSIKGTDGNYQPKEDNQVLMYDETTKIRFHKIAADTKEHMKGAKFAVYDSNGNQIYEFTTGETETVIDGVLKIGENYTFKETHVPKGYKKAADQKFVVSDTARIQSVTVIDEKIPETPEEKETTQKKTEKKKAKPAEEQETSSLENVVKGAERGPKTGDTMAVVPFAMLALISGCGVIILSRKRKTNKES